MIRTTAFVAVLINQAEKIAPQSFGIIGENPVKLIMDVNAALIFIQDMDFKDFSHTHAYVYMASGQKSIAGKR